MVKEEVDALRERTYAVLNVLTSIVEDLDHHETLEPGEGEALEGLAIRAMLLFMRGGVR